MNKSYQQLRIAQLDRGLAASSPLPIRAPKGWIRTVREALGLSLAQLADRLHSSRQLILRFEKSEAEDRITLSSLRSVASALDCELVYAFIPRGGSFQRLAEKHLEQEASKNVSRIEHHMTLEDQASGGIEQLTQKEADRMRAKNR